MFALNWTRGGRECGRRARHIIVMRHSSDRPTLLTVSTESGDRNLTLLRFWRAIAK